MLADQATAFVQVGIAYRALTKQRPSIVRIG
jgi:hypothetical protein